VRVRSYVVEQPVEEQVNLRDEHVNVERRPVDRPLTGADRDRAFQERTIEAEEKSEEAVVNKEARVKEELVVNKDVNQRTETVSDTVRRTEVDVQDERGDAATRSGERKPR
jgi:stress response protein YsnF